MEFSRAEREIEPCFALADLGGDRRQRLVLGRQRGRSVQQRGDVLRKEAGPRDSHAFQQPAGVLLGIDRAASLQPHRTGVHLLHQPEQRHARLRLAVHQRPLYGGRAAIARQQRRMDVDAAATRPAQPRLADLLAKINHQDQRRFLAFVKPDQLFVAIHRGRMAKRQFKLQRRFLHRHASRLQPAAGNARRRGHDELRPELRGNFLQAAGRKAPRPEKPDLRRHFLFISRLRISSRFIGEK